MDVNSRDPLQNIIPFRIKGVEISRFDSSGNLKIGTTTTTAPTVRLDISGGEARVNSGSAANTAFTTTGRIGVNTATPTVDLDVSGAAKIGNVSIGANPLYAFTSHTFTNAGATGRTGPTLSTVRTTYTNAGATWAATNVNMTTNGIQLWTVPVTGRYTIRAKGAAGFIGPGLSNARGIDIQTTTTLIKGEVIKILVGQRGSTQGLYANMGSGGGGSFVVREISTPIIIAGGGGGTGGSTDSYVNSDASRETYGMNGSTNIDSYGNNGGGGKGGQGSGGGGFLQDGFAGINNNIPPSSFLTGGVGGLATGGSGVGGFGGGGYAHDTTAYQTGGGGGGGYSGGGGGLNNAPGGGGGSFAISTITVNGYNTGHGSVTITLLSPSSDLDVSGVSRMSASSATATALTTVGRIGVNIPDPMADLEVVGAARLTASSATATALTTTGRIGVNTAAPSVDLDVSGAARITASSAGSTALTTTGRIGVNTAAPTVDLDVVGQGNILYGLILGSSTNSSFIGHLAQKLSIYHDINAKIFLRYGNSEGMLIGNYSGGSFITHRETTGEIALICEQNVPMKFKTNTAVANTPTRMTITGAGNVGIGTDAPTVALDVSGAANVSNYLSVGSSSGTTTSTLPNAFYVRTGGSNWRDYIPLLTANSTTNIQTWGGPDTQWSDVTEGAQNEIAKQYSYFAAYWLNANRAVNNTSFSVNSYAITTGEVTPTLRGTFTFTATVLIDGIVTGYTGVLSQGNHGTRTLTAQQDGINAGVARRQTLIMGGRVETGFLNVTGNINIAGSININNCKPRIAVTSNLYPGLKKSFIIPLALRSGGLIANKVYFTIRVPTISGTNTLYLKPNGSATTFHSYNQQIAGGFSQNGTNSNIGFKVCDVIGASAASGYTVPTHANIVGEFTIIRDTQLWGGSTPNVGTFPFTTRIYGTLVQYGNNYIQKCDFQGQALTGSNSDIYDRIDSFQFITSDTSVESDTGVSVTIEGD